MPTLRKFEIKKVTPTGLPCFLIIVAFFGYIAHVMGLPNMLNTIMKTAHALLLNTVFYLMAVCVITGALSRLFTQFGVASLMEHILRPLMRPLFNLPGVASLCSVMTFLSDNPAIIPFAKDKKFAQFFKKYEFISITNFGTAFGMGLIVIVFMISIGYFKEPLIGLFGAFCGGIIATRLQQYFILKKHPEYRDQPAIDPADDDNDNDDDNKDDNESLFLQVLNALLDGGKLGVNIGLSIIPGVLVISSLMMILTFGPGAEGYDGGAFQGVELLPWLASKIEFVFEALFGFHDSHLVAFPITALGAVGAALSIIPNFMEQGWIDGNAIAVFTAMGMCWSGYLSTHTAMLDTIGHRDLTSKDLIAQCVGGLCAGIVAHWVYILF